MYKLCYRNRARKFMLKNYYHKIIQKSFRGKLSMKLCKNNTKKLCKNYGDKLCSTKCYIVKDVIYKLW